VKGERNVTAADIVTGPRVEILNPEQHIATLSKDANLEMEMVVKRGRGYVAAEHNKEEGDPGRHDAARRDLLARCSRSTSTSPTRASVSAPTTTDS
jgi:DNA-directed RNA polymerase alpha subunit